MQLWAGWNRHVSQTAVENARAASVECSRALVERIEVDLSLADLAEQRRLTAHAEERPPVVA